GHGFAGDCNPGSFSKAIYSARMEWVCLTCPTGAANDWRIPPANLEIPPERGFILILGGF
ncbi:hypothetical protein ACFL02_06435, partial [Planctomycetota bacterium]